MIFPHRTFYRERRENKREQAKKKKIHHHIFKGVMIHTHTIRIYLYISNKQ